MRCIIFSYEYPPNVYGGAGVHVENLVRHLSKQIDIEIRVPGKKDEIIEDGNIIIRRYEYKKFGRGALSALSLISRMCFPEPEADILHFHTWYMHFGAVLCKNAYASKTICTVHSLEPLRPWKEKSLGAEYKISTLLEREGLRECDGIICVSKSMEKDLHRIYPFSVGKSRVVHNGIDTEIFKPTENREVLEKYSLPEKYALFVGRLSKQKGVDILFKVHEEIPDIPIVAVLGTSDGSMSIEDLKSDKSFIIIEKMVPENDLVSLYSHATIFLCPSRYEPFGIINLEAMACETPVVAFRTGGIKEVIVDGITGILVDPEDIVSFASTTERIFKNESVAKSMGKNGRVHVIKNFRWKEIAKRTLEYYKVICSD